LVCFSKDTSFVFLDLVGWILVMRCVAAVLRVRLQVALHALEAMLNVAIIYRCSRESRGWVVGSATGGARGCNYGALGGRASASSENVVLILVKLALKAGGELDRSMRAGCGVITLFECHLPESIGSRGIRFTGLLWLGAPLLHALGDVGSKVVVIVVAVLMGGVGVRVTTVGGVGVLVGLGRLVGVQEVR
jgi:hypothetical protein